MNTATSPGIHRVRRHIRHWGLVGVLLFALTFWGSAMAATPRITVLYPETKGSYALLFEQIIHGIEETTRGVVIPQAVPAEPDLKRLRQTVENQPNDAIIALGRRGIEAAKALHPTTPVIAGGVLYLPASDGDTYPAISLLPDPALLLQHLHTLSAKVRRVYLLYNPDRHQWLLPLAKKAAKQQRLTLDARPARDIRSAARLYREVLGEMRPGRDALWLLQDSTLTGDTSVLSYLLQEAWRRHLLIFSTSPAHVRRGALFSVYADKEGLGRDLGRLALRVIDRGAKPGLRPTREVNSAINLRTASHLGLAIPYQQQRRYNLMFPRP